MREKGRYRHVCGRGRDGNTQEEDEAATRDTHLPYHPARTHCGSRIVPAGGREVGVVIDITKGGGGRNYIVERQGAARLLSQHPIRRARLCVRVPF